MKALNYILATIFVMFSSATANAGTVVCSGKVDSLSYHANNKLMIKLDSMNHPVFFCSPDSVWNVSGTTYTTGPETCKTLYSSFLTAKISGKTIYSMYFDGDSVPVSCDGWEKWKNANIRFFTVDD